jgi:hypothetical protein
VRSLLHAAIPAASVTLAATAAAVRKSLMFIGMVKGYGVSRMLKPMLRGFGSAANSIPW